MRERTTEELRFEILKMFADLDREKQEEVYRMVEDLLVFRRIACKPFHHIVNGLNVLPRKFS